MECHTAELMVHRYIRQGLSEKELSDFLDHIEHCSSCYEELETYFIVHEATRQLDKDEEDTVFDIKGLLEQNIHQNKLMLKRRARIRRFGTLTILISAAALLGFVAEVILALL